MFESDNAGLSIGGGCFNRDPCVDWGVFFIEIFLEFFVGLDVCCLFGCFLVGVKFYSIGGLVGLI